MFQFNPRLAADKFDGEYIIANLDTGLYYSVQGIAVALLDALPFQDQHAVIRHFSEAMPQHAAVIQSELTPIFQQLLDEQILQQVAEAGVEAKDQLSAPTVYETPRFNRYADMQDLLMLDPIHDVDEAGWTVQQEASK